jgi:Lamin Tail Domain/Secretion system C-terminal sorting domain
MKRLNIILLIICICFITQTNAQSITISEINYKSAPSLNTGDWIELHNFSGSNVNIGGWALSDVSGVDTFFFPVNTIVVANGYLVVFKDPSLFQQFYPTVTNAIGNLKFSINTIDTLKLINSANNIVVLAAINSDKFWPDGADGEGRTLELINQNTNLGLNSVTAWRDGCMLGSPGAAPVACNDPIIFSELNYNSDSLHNIGEFVELYNTTNANFDLSNWYLKDGLDSVLNVYVFKPGTILAPNSYLVVSNDTAALKIYKGAKANFLGNFNFNLNNGGELIRLFNANNELKFSFHYRDSIPWTDSADGKGYTLEIKDKLGRTNNGRNYFAGCLGGSPGEAYNPVCKIFAPLAIENELNYSLLVYPILANDVVNIENAYPYYKNVQITDASGRVLQDKNLQNGITTLSINHYAKGVYYIVLKNKNGNIHCKKVIKL